MGINYSIWRQLENPQSISLLFNYDIWGNEGIINVITITKKNTAIREKEYSP
jgi:hypothetical protein